MYVNQELFIALKELASEGRIDSEKVSVIIQITFISRYSAILLCINLY